MWRVNRWWAFGVGCVMAYGAIAQEAGGAMSAPTEAVEAGTAPTASPSVALSLGAEVDAQSVTLERLSRAAEEKAAELRVAKLDEELRKARTPAGTETTGTSSEPILIGVYSGSQARVAEFSIGRTIRRVSTGGWIADGVRVAAIGDRSVVVSTATGTRRLFLNREVGAVAATTEPASIP